MKPRLLFPLDHIVLACDEQRHLELLFSLTPSYPTIWPEYFGLDMSHMENSLMITYLLLSCPKNIIDYLIWQNIVIDYLTITEMVFRNISIT